MRPHFSCLGTSSKEPQSLFVKCDSISERDKWIAALKKYIVKPPHMPPAGQSPAVHTMRG
jgi:hypothetical protein